MYALRTSHFTLESGRIWGCISCLILAAGIILLASSAQAFWFVEADAGAVFTGYNDVRVPGDSGTRFSLMDDLKPEPTYFGRIRLGSTFLRRHTVYALWAPLTVRSRGKLDKDIMFDGTKFSAGTTLHASFRFDSYRLSYRYDFLVSEAWTIGVGLTVKLRDAAIIVDGHDFAEKRNTGFVPLINLHAEWRFAPGWIVLLDGDGLAAPQGRAEDFLLAFQYQINEHVLARIGYRILEGGADNREVYTFSAFHYASAGLGLRF